MLKINDIIVSSDGAKWRVVELKGSLGMPVVAAIEQPDRRWAQYHLTFNYTHLVCLK